MRLLFSLFFVVISAAVSAQDDDGDLKVKIKGFADTYHAVRTESPNDWMSSRTRLRGELSVSKNNGLQLAYSRIFGLQHSRAVRLAASWRVRHSCRKADYYLGRCRCAANNRLGVADGLQRISGSGL